MKVLFCVVETTSFQSEFKNIIPIGTICVVHGHSHDCRGMSMVQDVPVINPGPFKDGFYCMIDIDGTCLSSVSFHRIDS